MRTVYLKHTILSYCDQFLSTLNLKLDLEKIAVSVSISSYLVSKLVAIVSFSVCRSFISHMAQFVLSREGVKPLLIWQAFKQCNSWAVPFRKRSTSQFICM